MRKTVATRRKQRLDSCALERHPYLILLSGPDSGRWYRLFPGVVRLGRSWDDCEVVIQNEGISRVHAEVSVRSGERVSVKDSGSTNGTHVNRVPVGREPAELRDGDKLQLGDSVTLKLAFQTALTAELHESMYSAAVRDGLTEVYNRAYLRARLTQELATAADGGTPLSVVMLDLDHFKTVNDTWGHAAGDQVLRTVAQRLQASVREDDILARYGGEEFVLVLPQTGLKPALRVAERLRHSIESEPVLHKGQWIPVTASLGVATTTKERVTPSEELVAQADANLYRAKTDGRNCVRGPLVRPSVPATAPPCS